MVLNTPSRFDQVNLMLRKFKAGLAVRQQDQDGSERTKFRLWGGHEWGKRHDKARSCHRKAAATHPHGRRPGGQNLMVLASERSPGISLKIFAVAVTRDGRLCHSPRRVRRVSRGDRLGQMLGLAPPSMFSFDPADRYVRGQGGRAE